MSRWCWSPTAVLQEEPITEKNLRIPKLVMSAPPQGDSAAVTEAAKLLVAAENPVIVAGRVARTPKGIELLVELAELLQARVQDQRMRMNFPSRASLIRPSRATPQSPNLTDADVILGLEAQDLWRITHKMTGSINSAWNRSLHDEAGREDHHAFPPSS